MRLRLTLAAALATALATTSLYPLHATFGWFWGALGAVVVTSAAGMGARRLRLPVALAPVIGLLALAWYLLVGFATHQALLGVVPTGRALRHLYDLATDGWLDINRYTAPVPPSTGVWLLTMLGVGLVAVLVDFLAVGLRRAALAGLPLLAMYSVPIAVRDDQSPWLTFVLGAVGYLTLLAADSRERIARWGRPMTGDGRTADAPAATAAAVRPFGFTGRRLGGVAIAMATLVPALVPGLHSQGLVGFGSGSRGMGSTTITMPDPLISVKRQLIQADGATVLTYRTQDPDPEYLRMYALDSFDGNRWTMSTIQGTRRERVSGDQLPTPEGLSPQVRVGSEQATISVDRHVQGVRALPVPYPPQRIEIQGDWRFDRNTLMVFSSRDTAEGRTYRVTALRPQPTREQLETAASPPANLLDRYTRLPRGISPKVRQLAYTITRDADTDYDKAVAIQRWFTTTGGFTYSLNPPTPNVDNSLAGFLLKWKTGYCEQFAAGMALLARVVGIPARVAVGYTAGSHMEGDTWQVTNRDAHAWPELYFAGVGWLRFEPTPAGATGQGSARVPGYSLPPPPASGGVVGPSPDVGGATPQGGGAAASTRRNPRIDEGAGTSGSSASSLRQRGVPIVAWLAVVGLLIVIGLTPAVTRIAVRRRRLSRSGDDSARAQAVWQELTDSVVDLGLPWRPNHSPRRAAEHLAASTGLTGPPAAALERIARAEERARYARSPLPGDTLVADVVEVTRALTGSTSRATRVRAWLMPMSTARAVGRGGQRLLGVVDRVELALSRVAARLLRRPQPRRS